MATKQLPTVERIAGTRSVAQRMDNAVLHFVEIATGLGVTEEKARKALPVMLRLRVVKIDAGLGRVNFSLGTYVAADVINTAAGMAK